MVLVRTFKYLLNVETVMTLLYLLVCIDGHALKYEGEGGVWPFRHLKYTQYLSIVTLPVKLKTDFMITKMY